MDYANGKIYKLVCNVTGLIYIGSTANYLHHRKKQHYNAYKTWLKYKMIYVTSYEIIKNGNYDIVLIENYPCQYRCELCIRERFYIKTTKCVNKNGGLYKKKCVLPKRIDDDDLIDSDNECYKTLKRIPPVFDKLMYFR